jgi:hypothetical protein
MKPLNLSPLPCVRSHEDPGTAVAHQDSAGFVDDEVVLALLRQPGFSRSTQQHGSLALVPNELDFAGWNTASACAS